MANAILMASGLGSRMRPLTNTTPKPLIRVNGIPMIETVIAALNKYGVENIYVVVGYLGDQFEYLTEKYENVSIIRNGDYETINNISSIYYARNELRQADTFICEADLFVSDVEIIGKTFKNYAIKLDDDKNYDVNSSCNYMDFFHVNASGYFGKMVTGYSDDWVFEQDREGFITRVGKVGTDCYNMCGLSFFRKEQAVKIADEIERVYNNAPGFEDLFWDDVVNSIVGELKLRVFPVLEEQIVEIDTVAELEEVNARLCR